MIRAIIIILAFQVIGVALSELICRRENDDRDKTL